VQKISNPDDRQTENKFFIGFDSRRAGSSIEQIKRGKNKAEREERSREGRTKQGGAEERTEK
jgi:hypothetical protein